MEEKTYHLRIAGEFIGMENGKDDPEEEIFQAIFEEKNDEQQEANLESSKTTNRGLRFSLEVQST